MPRTYFDESLAAQICEDECGGIRSISHPIGQVQRAATGPLEAAVDYLCKHRSRFRIRGDQLTKPPGCASYREPGICREQFRLLEDRHVFDSHTFFFAHTYLNIPVWNSGVKITVQDAPIRVVSAVNTTRHEVKASLPSDEMICKFRSLFPDDLYDPSCATDEVSSTPNPDAQKCLLVNIIMNAIKACDDTKSDDTESFLRSGFDANQPIARGRFYVYQYDKCNRVDEGVRKELKCLGACLQPVSKQVTDENWYVVAEITFPFTTPNHDRANLRMLVEPDTGSVLYLGSLAAEVDGYALRLDPISMTGCEALMHKQPNYRLNRYRDRVQLNNLAAPVGGCQHLAGKYVKLENVHSPPVDAPTKPSGDAFFYSVRTDDFAAVSAYFHTNQVFEVIESLGFPIHTYFKNTRFPIPVDHRGFRGELKAHCVGDGRGGIGHVCYGLMEKSNVLGPLGRACDPWVHWHELCGHGVLYEAVGSAGFHFAHSAGDGVSAIFLDPESGIREPPLRFEYSPWHPKKTRRFDRAVECGWAWGGCHDNQDYESEEILATCHFRIYRAIGGDSPDLGRRKFASRTMIYLILRAIHNLTPATNPRYAREFADELMVVDRLNWTSEDLVGGAYHKVIRWSFEKQGEYQTPLVTRDDRSPDDGRFGCVKTAGDPPDEDVYIDDGRHGEYEYQHKFWNTTSIWNRTQCDGGRRHQQPIPGATNYAYVKLQNRGMKTAHGVKVHGFHCRPSAGVSWPTGVQAMTKAMIDVGDVKRNKKEIVGPFEWTPTDGRGHDCLFMVASSNQDPSNISRLSDEETIAAWRLVPNDNNIAQRSLHVVPAKSPEAVRGTLNGASLWVRNPGRTHAIMRLEFRLPQILEDNKWCVTASDLDQGWLVLAPGEEAEMKITVCGADFDPWKIDACDRDIVVLVLADDGLVGGITYRLDPTLADAVETDVSDND